MPAPYQPGLTTLDQEIEVERLPVRGRLPAWLSGTLIRNGPARFEVGAQPYRHWFDGLSMLHRFTFQNGEVAYANKYLRSRDYLESTAQGKITRHAFATDPRQSLFQRLFSLFSPGLTDNANVNVTRLANRYLALTETPLCVEFDPHTLETLGAFEDGKVRLPEIITTAHPHFDYERGLAINYTVRLGRTSQYRVYCTPLGRVQRAVIGAVSVHEPAYMHSFGMTGRYVILVEFPLVVNPLRFLLSGKPFIENYQWYPEREARFHLMSKADGSVRTYSSQAFFAFHHVNAFEQNGDVFVDLAAYADTSIIEAFYLPGLRAGNPVSGAELRRYHLPARGATAGYELLTTEAIELPRLDYPRYNAKDYRYCYGVSQRPECPGEFYSQLVKVDVVERSARVWREENCYPGEPVFVAAPAAAAEDEGLVLSVVLDASQGSSFLLALDAGSFTEVARARVPHPIPFGFHGQFFEDEGISRALSLEG